MKVKLVVGRRWLLSIWEVREEGGGGGSCVSMVGVWEGVWG